MNVLPVGKDTLTWISSGGRPTRSGPWTLLQYRWQSWWFERNLALQRLIVASPIESYSMLFIVGMWRSGTTLLHNLLSADPKAIFPATWQCMNASSVGLIAQPSASAPVLRPMGDIQVDASSPQECEFALLARGVPSVYRALFDPRRLGESRELLNPSVWRTTEPHDWLPIYKDFLARVAAGRPGRLIIKSPTNTFRVRTLSENLPNSVFVWIARRPDETYLSNRHMWTAMFERYALWEWDSKELDLFIEEAMRRSTECLAAAAVSLPRSRLVVLDFDRFVANPIESVRALCNRLGIPVTEEECRGLAKLSAAPVIRRSYAQPIGPLTDESIRVFQAMSEAEARALESHGI